MHDKGGLEVCYPRDRRTMTRAPAIILVVIIKYAWRQMINNTLVHRFISSQDTEPSK